MNPIGQCEKTAEHLLFDCKALVQVRLTHFALVSKNGVKENMAGCNLRLQIFWQYRGDLHWVAQQALTA